MAERLGVFHHVGFFYSWRPESFGIQARRVSMSLLMEVMRWGLPLLLMSVGMV